MEKGRRNSLIAEQRTGVTEQDAFEINCRDITCVQDDWDVEEFVSKTCMGMFLHHIAFKLLMAGIIILNAVIIALRTEPSIGEKYFGLFSAIDTIVLSFLVCEVLLNWYYGFLLYWKDGWNIINFSIVLFLLLGLIIPILKDKTFVHVLRVMRLMQVCTLVSGLARMIQVILQSIPDMANIMILLFAIMLVFSVFGVTLFGSLVPQHFGNLGTALYSLFICITQDGWINIYDDFQTEGLALRIGGALYFFIFITFGAFIFANLLVAVVTINLEQSMAAYHVEKQMQQPIPLMPAFSGMDEDVEDNLPPDQQEPLHVKAVIHTTPMVHRQGLLSIGNLANLSESTCEELCIVLEAIHENLKEYRKIRDELNLIVEEVRSLRFNVEQEQEIVLKNIRGATVSETVLPSDFYKKPADILTTLMNLEKLNTDVDYQKGAMKSAAMRARRQSLVMPGSRVEKATKRRASVAGGPMERDTKKRDSIQSARSSVKPQGHRSSLPLDTTSVKSRGHRSSLTIGSAGKSRGHRENLQSTTSKKPKKQESSLGTPPGKSPKQQEGPKDLGKPGE